MVSVAKPFSMQTYIHLLTPVNWGQTSNLTCGQPSWMSAIAKKPKKNSHLAQLFRTDHQIRQQTGSVWITECLLARSAFNIKYVAINYSQELSSEPPKWQSLLLNLTFDMLKCS